MTGLTDPKSWGEVAKQHGIVAVLLVAVIGFNGYFIFTVFKEIPLHLDKIAQGYDKNAEQLNKAAEKFAGAALGILNEYKKDRLADRQAMIELIRAGHLDSKGVADAFEAASTKAERHTEVPAPSLSPEP